MERSQFEMSTFYQVFMEVELERRYKQGFVIGYKIGYKRGLIKALGVDADPEKMELLECEIDSLITDEECSFDETYIAELAEESWRIHGDELLEKYLYQ